MIIDRYKILKNNIAVCYYGDILHEIQKHISEKRLLLISPLASYTLVLAYFNRDLEEVLNKFTYLLADSQWIRMSLNFLYGIGLEKTITGRELMLKVCGFAQQNNFKISLYGTTEETLRVLKKKLRKMFPKLSIVYSEASKFRKLSLKEKSDLVFNIQHSGSNISFIALGSPLQEIFSIELFNNPYLTKPIVIIPVGAAFDFISGVKPQAPQYIQKVGFEWLFRFIYEPKRLWKRYLVFGPFFLLLIFLQKISLVLKNIKKN